MSPSSTPAKLPVSYATASAEAVAEFVTKQFDVGRSVTCHLLHRGFNDVYEVNAGIGNRFIFRVAGHRARGPADVASETAFLAFLGAEGVAVAEAVPARDSALFTSVALPDGPRAAVLFQHVAGRPPNLDNPDDARVQGAALARVHHAADRYPGRAEGRYRLDLDHLLHRQVAAVLALDFEAPQARGDLTALAQRLATAVERVDRDLTRTRCHGDCHGLNARIPAAGRYAGQAVLFDFDDGGFGYLAYDLAVHLWAQVSFGRRRHAVWQAFDQGYRTVRPMTPVDEAATPLFVAIRHIWLMGEYAGRTAEWGREVLSAAWLEREVGFLLAWERDKLSPGLL
ncbi:phosphotransferase enzyme family protein [Acidisphaera sp. L21]|uniref:phosphotransferase enzyme family protein n=1 Tax=Acidisphaera sp. L21 TaxID=1641851 RepID=UPI00131DFFE9|nr:phosphotransferase [Acidisphaera sp. L21]